MPRVDDDESEAARRRSTTLFDINTPEWPAMDVEYGPDSEEEFGSTASTVVGGPTVSTIDDAATFRHKARVGALYIATTTALHLLVLRMSVRAPAAMLLSLLPGEAFVGTAAGILLTWKSTSAPTRPTLRSFSRWKDELPLAGCIVVSSVALALQAGAFQPVIGAAVATYVAPALLLLLPLMQLRIPAHGFLLLFAAALPFIHGSFLSKLPVTAAALPTALLYIAAEAGKLAHAKRHQVTHHHASPSTTLAGSLPVQLLLSCTVLLPLLITFSTTADLYRPRQWPLYILTFIPLSLVSQYVTLLASSTFDSVVSVALLSIPRGILVNLLHGMGTQLHSAEFALISLLALAGIAMCIASTRPASTATAPPSRLPSRKPSFQHVDDVLDSHKLSGPTAFGLAEISSLHLSSRAIRILAAASFTPLLVWALSQAIPGSAYWPSLSQLPSVSARPETVDVVISTFNEDAASLRNHIAAIRYYPWVKNRDPRVILYMKGNITDAEEYRRSVGADVAIRLDNKGREAGTFLQHILRNYNASTDPAVAGHGYRPAGLADHTLFMQHHLAWDWIARERMWLWRENTGYLHFAPYLKLDCGKDLNGNGDFPRIAQIYSSFKEELCPPTLQLGAYSAQFVVSRKRILKNAYHKYKALDDVLEADAGHWIHQEGTWWHYHGEPGPMNPYLGHALERSWPIIFGCDDPSIADTCHDDNHNVTGCQCFD